MSTQPTARQRYERAGRLVHAFGALGLPALLAAAPTLALTPATRTAIEGARGTIRQTYERARAEYDAGDVERAANTMEVALRATRDVVTMATNQEPRARAIVERAAAQTIQALALAPLAGIGAGVGAVVMAALAVAVLAARGRR